MIWFDSCSLSYCVLRSGILAKDYMWLTESFELKATYIQFMVGLNYMLLGSFDDDDDDDDDDESGINQSCISIILAI